MDYREKPSLRANIDFYVESFETDLKLYSEMNSEEQVAWEETVKNHYYGWLNLTDEILNANKEKILESISDWLIKQTFAGYLVFIENNIVDAHRQALDRTIVDLDPNIRKENQMLIKEFDAAKDIAMEIIQAYTQHVSRTTEAKRTPMQL